MNTYISLLRGINVSGKNMIKMDDLRKIYESLRLEKVTTYIQSGNVIFQSKEKDRRKVQELIEKKIKEKLKLDVPTLVIPVEEFDLIIKNLPFNNRNIKNIDETRIYISFLFERTNETGLTGIEKMKEKDDLIILSKTLTEIYLYIPNGYGKSKLSNSLIENKLKVRSTTRNLNTSRKLIEIANNIDA